MTSGIKLASPGNESASGTWIGKLKYRQQKMVYIICFNKNCIQLNIVHKLLW